MSGNSCQYCCHFCICIVVHCPNVAAHSQCWFFVAATIAVYTAFALAGTWLLLICSVFPSPVVDVLLPSLVMTTDNYCQCVEMTPVAWQVRALLVWSSRDLLLQDHFAIEVDRFI